MKSIIISDEKRYKASVPKLHGNKDHDFHLGSIRVKEALRGKELIIAWAKKSVESNVNEQAIAFVIMRLGNNPLRSIQECETAMEVWEKLQVKYAGKTIINKISILNSLLNTKFQRCADTGNHISLFEYQFSWLASMGSTLKIEGSDIDHLIVSEQRIRSSS